MLLSQLVATLLFVGTAYATSDADLAWARGMLRERRHRLARRAGPSEIPGVQSNIVTSAGGFNDCGVFGDPTKPLLQRTFFSNPGGTNFSCARPTAR